MTQPRLSACPHCKGSDLYTRSVASGGGYGPALLEGLGGFLWWPNFHVVLCATCGHCTFFADKDARDKVRTAKSWKRLSDLLQPGDDPDRDGR